MPIVLLNDVTRDKFEQLICYVFNKLFEVKNKNALLELLLISQRNDFLKLIYALILRAKTDGKMNLLEIKSLNNFLLQIIRSKSKALHDYVHNNLSDLPASNVWSMNFKVSYFTLHAQESFQTNTCEAYLQILKDFHPDFFSFEPDLLWELMRKILVGYFLTTPLAGLLSTHQLNMSRHFYTLLLYRMGSKKNVLNCTYKELPEQFDRARMGIASLDTDLNALRFVKSLFEDFEKLNLTDVQSRNILSFFRSYLSECFLKELTSLFDFSFVCDVLYAHMAKAPILEHSCIESLNITIRHYLVFHINLAPELLLELQLITGQLMPESFFKAQLESKTQQLAPMPAIGVLAKVITTLSKNKSAISLLHMIGALHLSTRFIRSDMTIWTQFYKILFKSFKKIKVNDPLFNDCILALNENYTADVIPQYTVEPKRNLVTHKLLYSKILDFNLSYFSKSDDRKIKGFFPLMELLRGGLNTNALSPEQYLKYLESTCFDWSFLRSEENQSYLLLAYYDLIIKEDSRLDKERISQLLFDWIVKLSNSEEITFQQSAKFIYDKTTTEHTLSEQHYREIFNTFFKR